MARDGVGGVAGGVELEIGRGGGGWVSRRLLLVVLGEELRHGRCCPRPKPVSMNSVMRGVRVRIAVRMVVPSRLVFQ